jgi:hypothetical protein
MHHFSAIVFGDMKNFGAKRDFVKLERLQSIAAYELRRDCVEPFRDWFHSFWHNILLFTVISSWCK